ncbi:receptor-type tyrosine-protein phosphatase T-like [Ruditapes philippinarum]|uniref:receptor-type tyrosine-protein phosphatase T-like n=1 Tax=Ruditapes philippinarum TaxID=129788 RepID=UPI00295B928B|nr:receptor-type tyrosine-protein phosphatase T-like [Ruditapes philippinarum]
MADASRNTNRVYINTTVGDSSNQTYFDFRNSESLPKTAIKIDDLQDVVFNGNNGNNIFETQFKALPQGMVENFSEAVKLENKGKNRYTRLYAYDDTRVVLNTEEDSISDYINACYVHGFNKSRKYIATQGPTKNTVADFWWMVWQEDTSKIVMLTNLIEEGRNKCIKYWPDDMEEYFGKLKICLKKVETNSQFDIRTLSVKKDNSAEKTVTQFHFTVWPDKGIPRYASALVHFLKKVNNAPTHGSSPIIVHCSAGVGRTGTYIALDYLTDQGKTLGYVDVAGCVDSLRRQRVSLVQTLDQYIFVHRALVESLMMSSSTIPAQKFQERYCELQKVDPNKNKTRICIDFENLQRVSPPSEDSLYVSAKLVVNRQKNRDPNVLPVEDFMPFVTSDDGRPIYINCRVLR